ncbi:MAG: serine/threonine protein kinase [Planctomycetes bacterium]|nr:serine/threonine protein kinase [Planctomycetota bacterium]
MTEPSTPPPAADYEDVLVRAIGLLESDDPAAVERLLSSHPSHAARLRAHLSRLQDLGFTGESAAKPTAPEQVGDFRLLQRLGSGGMGVVYLARQQSLGRNVALKLVRLDLAHLPGARERFRREVAAIARLQHPGIVPVYDAGEDGGVPWLAMEHVVGASLDAVTKSLMHRDPATLRGIDLWHALLAALPPGTTLPAAPPPAPLFNAPWPTACLQLVRAVALALHHAHERGVLHRDLKPSNIMLTLEGRALLLDFGLAVGDGDARLTRSGSQLGTLAYMAPEQVRGETRAIDARSDVYSLAITAWELLTLRLPFTAESDGAMREQVLAGRLPPLRGRNRAVPRDVETVLRKACDLDPTRRYQDAAAFADDLGNLLELRPIRAQPPGVWLQVRRWSQRHPARATAIVAGALLFLGAPTGFLMQAKAANREIQGALKTANDQRRLADEQRDLSREAVDSLLERVAEEHLFDVPKMQRVRRDLLERARSFYERFLAMAPDDLDLLERTARATLKMVFVEGSLGQIDFATSTVDRAVELATSLRTRRPGDDATLLLADALLTRGRIHLMRVQPETALEDFQTAERLARDVLARAPAQPLAVVHLLGIERGVSLAMRALDRRADYEASLRRLAELWRTSGDATIGHDYRDVALDHVLCAGEDEARLLLEERRIDEARTACARTEAILATIAVVDIPISSRIAMASLPLLRARIDGGDPAVLEQRTREALKIAADILAEHPEQHHAMRLRANMENGLGLLLAADPARAAEALTWLERSLQTLRTIVASDPIVLDNRANLAATLVNIGSQHIDAGAFAKALELFTEAEQLTVECTTEDPRNERWQQYRYNATWFLAQTCGELGDHAGEAAAARRLVALRPTDGKTCRIAAELLAHASTKAATDQRTTSGDRQRRQDELAAEALRQLAAAAEHGYADAARLRDGGKLAPLRAMPGFAAVLERVTANAAAGK